MPPSPIRKLVPFAEAAEQRGIKVHYLNIGQPDIETPPAILKAVRDSDFKILAYSHSAGNASYREKLTQYYLRHDIRVSAREILVTTGGSEAILFGMMSCLDPGDEIIVPEPFYANYHGFATEAQAVIRPVPSDIGRHFALPPKEAFAALIGPRTRAILICNPNNPTGYLYPPAELELLRELCLEHDLYLFADEAYREFCYEGTHISAMNLSGLEQHVVLMDTISKRYSACGGRIGALVTHNTEVLDTALKFAQARLCPPGFAQILGEAAVDLPLDYFDGIKEAYRGRRNLMVRLLQEMPGVRCPLPGGAFYAMAELPVDDAEKFCRWLLEDFSHEGQTLMLAPGAGFYASEGLGLREVRLAYVLCEEDIRAAMTCLQAGLEQYPGRKK